MQIIVLGMHRSGTSMVTRLVNMMGAYFSPEDVSMGFAPDNPKGFWERWDVMRLNDSLLHLNGCSWDKVGNWSFDDHRPMPEEDERSLRTIVMGMDGFRPWVLKDPRMCLTLPYWSPFLEVPIAVIVHRDPGEVIASLGRRNGMDPVQALALWEYHAVGMLEATRDMPRVVLGMDRVLSEPVMATKTLFEALERHEVQGLRMPSSKEILSFVEPALATSRHGQGLTLTSEQERLVALVTGHAEPDGGVTVSEASARAMPRADPTP